MTINRTRISRYMEKVLLKKKEKFTLLLFFYGLPCYDLGDYGNISTQKQEEEMLGNVRVEKKQINV